MLFLTLQKLQTINSLDVEGIELRLDLFPYISKDKLRAFFKNHSVPILLTLRRTAQRSEEQRLQILEDLLSLKPHFVDLEYDTDPFWIHKIRARFPKTKILISYHNTAETPADLDACLQRIFSPHAYAYKIATFARSSLDALRMLLFVKKHPEIKLSGICMGEEGTITRILGPLFGNFISYAPLSAKEATALGQIPFAELHSVYHYARLNPATTLYGLIGNPVHQSIGHHVHNALFRHHGWNAVYVKMRVQQEELSAFLPLAKQCGFQGLSVTMPLKQSLGGVNTLYGEKSYNTDGKGALDALEIKTPVKGKKIVLLGAGGAAQAIAQEALKRGAKLSILNRTPKRAIALASSLGCRGGSLMDSALKDYAILINATSHPCPIDQDLILPATTVMDIHTVPKWTPLLQEAKKKGCVLVFGYEMFVQQALGQLKIWFSHTACPIPHIDPHLIEQECLKWI